MRSRCEIDEVRILQQIVGEKHHPLAVIREAISNSWDACAERCRVRISAGRTSGTDIEFLDDGTGISEPDFAYFFGLGFSHKEGPDAIGHKGLGTKLYFNSDNITVYSKTRTGQTYQGVLERPRETLEQGQIPSFEVEESELGKFPFDSGTRIILQGVPASLRSPLFASDYLKAYIHWFTAAGRTESILNGKASRQFRVSLERIMRDGRTHISNFESHKLPEVGSPTTADHEMFAKTFDPFHFDLTDDAGTHLGTARVAGAVVGSRAHIVGDRRIKKRFKGFFVGTRYLLVKNVSTEVFGGTGEWQNLHVVVDCDGLKPSMNREDFVDTTPGSLYGELIKALRRFANSLMKGARFSYRGRVIERSSNFAGKVFSEFHRIKRLQKPWVDRAGRIVRLFALSRGRQLPLSFKGGPVWEPQDATGVLLTFQALATMMSGNGDDSISTFRVLATSDDMNGVFIQNKTDGGWGAPLLYRASFRPDPDEINYMIAEDAYDGLICWEIRDDDGGHFRSKYGDRLIVVSDSIDQMVL